MKGLKEARKKARLTQAELAEKVGITQQMVYAWEKGISDITGKNLNK